MGFYKTIHAGSRAAIWSKNGSVKVVDGPKRPFIMGKKVEILRNYIASEAEYLEVRKKAGPVQIFNGPCSAFMDPVLDEQIIVQNAIMIDASEALVVYCQTDSAPVGMPSHDAKSSTARKLVTAELQGGRAVRRRVVRGPARFVPASNEWIHNFEWSGQPKDGSKTSYQPKALKFQKLKTIPMTAYHNVNEVRTNDDTLITVKLMLFFELLDAEKMLDASNDPIGDFINAASSDTIAFCAGLSYETFLNETAKLNQLSTFAQLVARAEQVGYNVTKVVFRGFQAGDKLQAMHDNAIQERTRLRLKEENAAQEQRAMDMELDAARRRATKEAELEAERARTSADLALLKDKAQMAKNKLLLEEQLESARQKHEAELARLREKEAAQLEFEQKKIELEHARNAEQLHMMREMKGFGVDLTQVLVSQQEQVSSVIKLASDHGGMKTPAAEKKSVLGALQLNLS